MFNISKIMFRARATCRNLKQSPVFVGPTNFMSTWKQGKKKKERPLKEFYNVSFKQSLFSTLRPQSLITNAHTSLEHTHIHWQQRTGDDRNTALRTNTHKSTQGKKKKKVRHRCLQHSSQSLRTHPRLNKKEQTVLPIIPR